MTDTLTNCVITKNVYNSDEEEVTAIVTANDGYTFTGTTPSIKCVMFDKIYLTVSADGKTASCTSEYTGEDYYFSCEAVASEPEPVLQFTHDITSIEGYDCIDVEDENGDIIDNALSTSFDAGTTIGSIVDTWWIGEKDSNQTNWHVNKRESNNTLTFTDSSGVKRTITLENGSLSDSRRYVTVMSSTQKDYKVNSNIVWNISTHYYEPPIETHTIQQTLTNATSDCELTSINDGTALTITVKPTSEYHFDRVPTCEMGSVSIKSSQLENGYSFAISSVTDNIIVVAEAVSDNPTEVNNADYGFINIYNPTKNELKEASNKWFYDMSSGSYIDLSKYISALFITYAKPLVLAEKQSIKFSSYDTTVLSHVVREPKITLECGTITVEELHHNALDYSPNSSARIFLPFIGYENISIDLIMESELSLTYEIDVLSGRCLAKLQVNKDNNVNVYDIYTFVGDCSLQIPYFMNNGESSSNTIVNKAHNLDNRTPFLLIERATAYMPNSSQLDGVSSNELAILGDLTGYTKCKEVLVSGIDCSSAEKNEIESLLKKGVIL